MLMLSKKVEYGLIAMLHMSSVRGGGLVTSKDVSDHYHMPAELLGKVLQALAKGGLVDSIQGARGGYRLARPIESINLGQVIEALEGPVLLARCQEDPALCGQYEACNIKGPIHHIHEQLQDFIYGLSLGSFQRPVAEGVLVRVGEKVS